MLLKEQMVQVLREDVAAIDIGQNPFDDDEAILLEVMQEELMNINVMKTSCHSPVVDEVFHSFVVNFENHGQAKGPCDPRIEEDNNGKAPTAHTLLHQSFPLQAVFTPRDACTRRHLRP
jgi:hypothetical protein